MTRESPQQDTGSAKGKGEVAKTKGSPGDWVKRLFVRLGVLPFLLLLALIIFTMMSDHFLTSRNLLNVARQSTYLTIVSMGQMFALLTGGSARLKLYSPAGLTGARSVLRPGGLLVVWSSHFAPGLLAALQAVEADGGDVSEEVVVVERGGRTLRYALYSLALPADPERMTG